MKRRQYLATLTVAGSFAVAGCGSNSSDGNGSSNTGPKGAVRTYFTALEHADANARNEIVHADSPLQSQSFGRKRESIEYTINSLETVEQPVPANANNYDTVETFQAVKVTVTLAGEVDGETREEALDTTVVVAQNTNGNWKFWLPIGAMQSTTEDTGEEVTEQVTNRLVEENTVGMVDGNQVDAIEMTVRLAAGSSDVNLKDVTIQLVTAIVRQRSS